MRLFITLLAVLLISGCLKEDTLNMPFGSYQPEQISDGLLISTPMEEGIDPQELTEVYKHVFTDESLWPMRSLLVFKNNKLVSEAYLKNEEDITNRHLIWSCTKQVVGILTGIALENGTISSLDTPLSECLPLEVANDPVKAAITLRQLLTMQSGIDFNNDGIGGDSDKILRQEPSRITSYILSLPMKSDPGIEFLYKDGDPQLVSAIIQEATGGPMDTWADEVFFSKIGVSNYNWVRYKDGTTLGGFGIETTPRELGKIAMCVANQGKYGDQQIIPAAWISEMCQPRVETPLGYSFGFYWWVDTTRNIHFMWGHGGQFAFIVPTESLVVIMTSIPNTQGDYQVSADDALLVVDEIINSCY